MQNLNNNSFDRNKYLKQLEDLCKTERKDLIVNEYGCVAKATKWQNFKEFIKKKLPLYIYNKFGLIDLKDEKLVNYHLTILLRKGEKNNLTNLEEFADKINIITEKLEVFSKNKNLINDPKKSTDEISQSDKPVVESDKKTNEPSDPISSSTSTTSSSPLKPAAQETSYSTEKCNTLIDKKDKFVAKLEAKDHDAITLFDTKEVLEYRSLLALKNNEEEYNALQSTYDRLSEYFEKTRQQEEFIAITNEIEKATLLDLIKNEKDYLVKALKTDSNDSASNDSAEKTLCVKLCQSVLNEIVAKKNHQPSIHGHPRDLYQIDDQKIIEFFNDNPVTSILKDQADSTSFQLKQALSEAEAKLLEFTKFSEFEGVLEKIENVKNYKHPVVAIEGAGPTGLLATFTQFRSGANIFLLEKRDQFDRTQIVRLDPKWMTMLRFYLGEDYYKLFVDENSPGKISPDGFGEITTCFLERAFHKKVDQLILKVPFKKSLNPEYNTNVSFIDKRLGAEITDISSATDSFNIWYKKTPSSTSNSSLTTPKPPMTIGNPIDMLICAGGKESPMKNKFLPSSTHVTQRENYGVCSWLTEKVNKESVGTAVGINPSENIRSSFPNQNSEFNMFQDFRGVVHIDQDFIGNWETNIGLVQDSAKGNKTEINSIHTSFREKLEKIKLSKEELEKLKFSKEELEILKLSPEEKLKVSSEELETLKLKEEKLEKLKLSQQQLEILINKREYFQTRTFENLGVIYIGMEIPVEIQEIFNEIKEEVTKEINENFHLQKKAIEDLNISNQAKNQQLDKLNQEIKKEFNTLNQEIKNYQIAWFQSIAQRYELDKKHGLQIDQIDTKFAATFPVSQSRLHGKHFFSELQIPEAENRQQQTLFVTAAGDANNSPHFMRYSGLTGAREDILGLQKRTKALAHNVSFEELGKIKTELEQLWEKTAEFVISRGSAFLLPADPNWTASIRKLYLIEAMKAYVADQKKKNSEATRNVIIMDDKAAIPTFIYYSNTQLNSPPIQIHFNDEEGSLEIKLPDKKFDSIQQLLIHLKYNA